MKTIELTDKELAYLTILLRRTIRSNQIDNLEIKLLNSNEKEIQERIKTFARIPDSFIETALDEQQAEEATKPTVEQLLVKHGFESKPNFTPRLPGTYFKYFKREFYIAGNNEAYISIDAKGENVCVGRRIQTKNITYALKTTVQTEQDILNLIELLS